VFVIALLFYAVGTRYNAALAALPLFLWLGQLAARRLLPGREPARLIAVTVGVGTLLVIGGLNWSIAKRLVDDRQTYPSHQIMVHDLIGISVRTRSVLVPSFLADTALSLSAIDCVYSTHDAVAAFSGSFGRCPITLRKLTRAGEVAQLRAVWLDGIRRHPRAYTAHRWDVWLDQLALGVEDVHYPLQSVNDPNRLGIESLPSRRHDRALQLFSVAAYRTPLFRAWPYLLIAVAVLVVGIRITADPVPLLVLVSSAVLYELGYIVISTGSAFRFNWWPVVAAIVAVTFIIPRRELPG
jgi:uncharacterized membrane protein YidH (DUF202 family)